MSVTNETGLEIPVRLPTHKECLRLYPQAQEFAEWLQSNPVLVDLVDGDVFLAGSVAVNGYGNDIDLVVPTEELQTLAEYLIDGGFEISSAELYRGIDSDGWCSAKLQCDSGVVLNLLLSELHIVDLWEASTLACIATRTILGRDLTRDERVMIHRHVWGEV